MISNNLSRKAVTLIATVTVSLLIGATLCVCVLVPFLKKSSPISTPFINKEKILAKFETPRWTNYNSSFSIEDAFVAEIDPKGDPVFICRALFHSFLFNGDIELLPGTFDPRKGICRVSYGQEGYEYTEFQVLMVKDASSLVWVQSLHGTIPGGTVIGGQTQTDLELPIAKFEYENEILIGKVDKRYGLAYGEYGGLEVDNAYYDVLTMPDISL